MTTSRKIKVTEEMILIVDAATLLIGGKVASLFEGFPWSTISIIVSMIKTS